MHQYLDLLRTVRDTGICQSNRTGIDTLTIPGAMMKFDLREGFPAVTTKRLAWKAVVGELIGFLRGSSSLAEFKALGCNVWDENVLAKKWQDNPECEGPDDMGRIYGTQWRDWRGTDYHKANGEINEIHTVNVDQIAVALDTLRNNPESRRIIVNAWNPAEIDQAALPPCHVLFQLLPHVDSKVLHMTMYQRSCDMFLGVPFNIASYALLLELFAWWSGYTAGTLTMMMADTHIYVNHLDQVNEQLNRAPLAPPRLWIDSLAGPEYVQTLPIDVLIASLDPAKIHLLDYHPHDAIKAPMAV